MILLAVFSYYCIDKAVASWTYYNTRDHQWHLIWQYATYLQPMYNIWAPWFIVYLAFRLAFGNCLKSWHGKVLIMIFSMWLALDITDQLRVVFGRYWASTWFHGNLSYIQDNAYGFTWFKSQHEFKSFPSGHTALIFGFMASLWWLIDNKKIKLFALANCLAVAIGLILMCYHFVSDVIIGALVGILCSYLILYVLQKNNNKIIK
jgi:membrane-associated phospholipid phosphatase